MPQLLTNGLPPGSLLLLGSYPQPTASKPHSSTRGCKILPGLGCFREFRLGFLDGLRSREPVTVPCSIAFGQGGLRCPGGSWLCPEHPDPPEQGQCDLRHQHLKISKRFMWFLYNSLLKLERVTGNTEKYPPNIFVFFFFGDTAKSFNHEEKPSPRVMREFHHFLQTKPYSPTVATISSAVASDPSGRWGLGG